MKYAIVALEIVLTPILYFALSLILGFSILPAALLVRWAAGFGYGYGVLALGPAYFLFGFCLMAATVLVKWGTLYRAREGSYRFFSWQVGRWAVVTKLYSMVRFMFLAQIRGTWMFNLFLRALGAKIGSNVIVAGDNINDWDLIEIGDDTMIGGDAVIIGHVGEKGMLNMGRVRIGRNCTVGQNAMVMPGVTLEDGAVLGAISVASKGKTLPANTVWGGTELRQLRARGGRVPAVRRAA